MLVCLPLAYNSLSISMGWSQQILQFVAFEAGAILDKTIAAWVKQHGKGLYFITLLLH